MNDKKEFCEWTPSKFLEDTYDRKCCDVMYYEEDFDYTHYCPNCGKKIKVVRK